MTKSGCPYSTGDPPAMRTSLISPSAGALMARYVGIAWLGYGLLNWQARAAGAETQRIALAANLIPTGLGVLVTLFGIATGIGSVAMWFWVALFAVFAAGDAYFVTMSPALKMTQPARA